MQESRLKKYIKNSPVLSTSLFSFASLFLGILLCLIAYHYNFIFAQEATKALRLAQNDYPLINPLLLCNIYQRESNEDSRLTSLVQKFVNERIQNGTLKNMSVYIINYGESKWSGVNEDERYDPASMLKVPIMMAYYKTAEKDPGLLNEKTSFTGDDQNEGEYFKSTSTIKAGKMYTIEELIESMIKNSDNTASTLLENFIDKKDLYNAYTALSLPVPKTAPNIEYLSAKLYAYFFRVLYNGTYLDKKYSERALEYMTYSDISGIRAGVPNGVTVAQKFGERSVYDTAGKLKDRELHDCGIIYKPNNPYLLCVMSRGTNFDDLAKNIKDLSTLVYENIDK